MEQRKLGHDVTVAVDRKRPGLSSEEPAVPKLQSLQLLDEGGLELSVKSSPWTIWQDLRTLRRRTVEVVHAHFTHDHFLARLARPRNATLVRSLHAPRSLRRTLPAADAFTVTRAEDLKRLPKARACVLPPLVGAEFQRAPDVASTRSALGLEGEPVIGMASTFQRSRRHDLAVEAFARILVKRPQARLVLLGDGEEEERTRAQVRDLGLAARVTFAGYQSGAAFARWLSILDELWVLGLGNDWSGRVAAQARACGVRVIAVPLGGLPDLADTLVPDLSPDALASASLSLGREPVLPPTNAQIAERVLALYAEAASS